MALMAYTPFAVIVLISAWMPAPPLESLPAIVNAVYIIFPPRTLSALILYSDLRWCPQSAAVNISIIFITTRYKDYDLSQAGLLFEAVTLSVLQYRHLQKYH